MEGNGRNRCSEMEKSDEQKNLDVAQGNLSQKIVKRKATTDQCQNKKKEITSKVVANANIVKSISSNEAGVAQNTLMKTKATNADLTVKAKKDEPHLLKIKLPTSKGSIKSVTDRRNEKLPEMAALNAESKHGGLIIEEGIIERPSSSGSVSTMNMEIQFTSTELAIYMDMKKRSSDIKASINEDIQEVNAPTRMLLDGNVQQQNINRPNEEQVPSPSGIMIKTELKEIPLPTKIIMEIDADEYFIQGEPIRRRNMKKIILNKYPLLKKCPPLSGMKMVFNDKAYLGHSYPKVFWHKCRCKVPAFYETVAIKSGIILEVVVYIKCRRHKLFEILCRYVHRYPLYRQYLNTVSMFPKL